MHVLLAVNDAWRPGCIEPFCVVNKSLCLKSDLWFVDRECCV